MVGGTRMRKKYLKERGLWELLERQGAAEILTSLKSGEKGFNEFRKVRTLSDVAKDAGSIDDVVEG